MGVVNTKSNRVTLAEATPIKPQPAALNGGIRKSIIGYVAVAAGDDNNSVYRICRVHSSWVIQSIKVFCTAITDGTDYNVGLYQTAENGGADADENCYADAITLASALAGSEVAYEARALTACENRVWQDAGASADTKRFYDLCLTAVTVGTAAGTIMVQVEYTSEA